jgi:hypothetical protein
LQSGPLQAGRALLHALPLQPGQRRRTRPQRQTILPLQTGLARRVVARIISRRVGLPQRALPADDLAADALSGVDLARDALIAQRLLKA